MQRFEGFERPKLCRLCEFPVVDGGVRVSREELDKVSRWMERKFGSGLLISAEEQESSWWICQFCSWDARFYSEHAEEIVKNRSELTWWHQVPDKVYEKYYKEDFLKPCFVDMGVFPQVESKEEEDASFSSPSISNDALEPNLETADTLGNGKIDRWFCVYCSKSFHKNLRKSEHMKRSHKDLTIIRCPQPKCSTFFKTEDDRTDHVQNKHKNVKSASECIYCNKWIVILSSHVKRYHKNEFISCSYYSCTTFFKTEIDKEDHIKQVHQRKHYPCLFCDHEVTYYDYKSLVHHTNIKHGELLFKCKVLRCGFYFKTEVELQSHLVEKHPQSLKAKIYKCNHCNYKSDGRSVLKYHLIDVHGPKILGCSLCTKKFGSKRRLNDHFKQHVKKSCPYCQLLISSTNLRTHVQIDFCKYCKKKFPCYGVLKKHEIQCRNSVGWICSICSINFIHHSSYKYHMKLKHNKQNIDAWSNVKYQSRDFKCAECKIYFKHNYLLRTHQTSRHEERTVLTCDLCKKQINSKHKMATHLSRVHIIRNTFKCSVCSRSYTHKTDLRNHWNNVHSRKREVECKKCGKIMFKKNLALHTSRFH